MIVFRLSKSQYAKDISGTGAERSGGRWNSKGTPLLYTSASRALCTTEIAVHTPLGILPLDYKIITIEIDNPSMKMIETKKLPRNWKRYPHIDATQKIGDQFVSEDKYLVMKVPSVIVQDEFNYLINPLHKDIHKVKIKKVEDFNFDPRLFIR